MLKKLVFLLLLFIAKPIFAQDDKLDKLPFEDEPLKETKSAYFAIAGGFVTSFNFINLDEFKTSVNTNFKSIGFGDLKSPIIMTGGEGYTGIPWIPNSRVAIIGMGGSSVQSKSVGDTNRSIELSVSHLGVKFDYGYIPFKSMAILPGIGFGYGSNQITYNQSVKGADWANFSPNDKLLSYDQHIERTYYNFQINLNIEYALTNFFVIRAGAGYHTQISAGNWVLNKNSATEVAHVPTISNSGLVAQVGLFLGLFNY